MIHLVLHFDINETILIGDDAGGDSFEQCINKIIAKSAFVRVNNNSIRGTGRATNVPLSQQQRRYTSKVVPTHWWDGSSIRRQSKNPSSAAANRPPPVLWTEWEWPNQACPYYRTSYRNQCGQFTHQDGRIYRQSYYETIYQQLHPNRWDERVETTKTIGGTRTSGPSPANTDNDTHHLHPATKKTMAQMLPAFFDTLIELNEWCGICNTVGGAPNTNNDAPPNATSNASHSFVLLLQQQDIRIQHVTIVLRTFGSDLHPVMEAIQLFMEGQHPEYPDVAPLQYLLITNRSTNQNSKIGDHVTNNATMNPIVQGRWMERTQKDRYGDDNEPPVITGTHSHHADNYEYQLMDDNNVVIASGDANVVQWLHTIHLRNIQNGSTNDDNNNSTTNHAVGIPKNTPDHNSDVNEQQQTQQQATPPSSTSHPCGITICGIQDDYDHWSKYHCVPWAGKPIWKLKSPAITVTSSSSSNNNANNSNDFNSKNVQYHHVLFDDNMCVSSE